MLVNLRQKKQLTKILPDTLNYQVVLELKTPNTIPWVDKKIYVAVPKQVSSICAVTK